MRTDDTYQPDRWDHPATGAALRVLQERAQWWNNYANRSGHHPYAADEFWSVSIALLYGRRLTTSQANHLRSALASHKLTDPAVMAQAAELLDAARGGHLLQDEDGRLQVVDHYDQPPYSDHQLSAQLS